MKNRSEIQEEFKWDLSSLCKSDEEFYNILKQAKEYLPLIKTFEGKLNDKKTILEYLNLDKKFSHLVEPIISYASMKKDEELSNSKYQLMFEKLSMFFNEFSIETSFVSTELNLLSDEMLDNIIADKEFANYDRMFESIKKTKKHQLSKEEEKLLAGMDFLGGFSNNMRQLSDVDFTFEDIKDKEGNSHPFNLSLFAKYIRSLDRVLRENAFKRLNGTFGKAINMLSANYISEVKANCYFSKVRKYQSVLSSALEGEEVSEKVYYTLIKMVRKNLPMLFDYYDLKKKELGLDDFYIYDCMADTSKEDKQTFTYDQAIELIKEAVSPLGEEYVSLIQKAKDECCI